MKRLLCFLVALVFIGSGCGESKARTSTFVPTVNATSLLGLGDGSLRYAVASGYVYDVDKYGKGLHEPITKVDGASSLGVLGMVEDSETRTFASWVNSQNHLVVGQIVPGPTRIIYTGSDLVNPDHPGGRLALSAENRIVSTLSLQNSATTGQPNSTSEVISLDPDRNDDQKENVLSKKWSDLGGIAYAAGHVLWAIDRGNLDDGDRLARTGVDGPTGTIDNINKATEQPVALAPYGDTELVACFAKTGNLQRFSISDGIQTLAGRKLAGDCTGDTTQMKDGRLAYVADNQIRVTAL